MGRRAPGEGSIYKLADGRYAASVTLGYRSDGKRIRRKVEGRTRREVADKLAVLRQQQDAGVNLATRTETCGVFLMRWLNDVFAPSAKPKSIQTYRWAINKVLPVIGPIALQKLKPMKAQQLITDLSRGGLAPKSVNLVLYVLLQAFDHATTAWKLIGSNPFEHVVGPKIESKSAPLFLTPAQAAVLLVAADGERLEVAIRLMVSLGLRRGEVCALRWSDIDFEQRTIAITGTLQHIADLGLHRGTPKSKKQRILPLPATLLAALRWHQLAQEQEQRLMGWGPSEYVFRNTTNGGPLNPGRIYDVVQRLAAQINENDATFPADLHPHALRHSCASFLIASNVHPKLISEILGHANIQITLNLYGHLFPGQLDEAADKVESLLETSQDRRSKIS